MIQHHGYILEYYRCCIITLKDIHNTLLLLHEKSKFRVIDIIQPHFHVGFYLSEQGSANYFFVKGQIDDFSFVAIHSRHNSSALPLQCRSYRENSKVSQSAYSSIALSAETSIQPASQFVNSSFRVFEDPDLQCLRLREKRSV